MLSKLSVGLVALLLLALGLGLSSAAVTGTTVTCQDASVAGFSGFNDAAICPSGTATGGGYQLTSRAGDLLGISVNESMPFLRSTTPTGWQVVGSNTTGIAGTIRVCVLCRP